jgi:membrane protease subunit HflC
VSRATGIILLLIIAAIAGWESFYVVDETELAIVTQFGEFRYSVNEPGIYRKIPLIQKVQRMERRILGSDTPPSELLTLDKKRIVADPITRWRIVDPLRFYITVHDESGAKARLDDIVNSELREVIARRKFGDIVGNERDPMMQKVAESVRRQTREFGIDVVDVRIKRADLPSEVQESVFARMRAEREREAKRYRSEGEEKAIEIRAETDKEREIILSEAKAKAEKLRGEGDAKSIAIYAEAYDRDPEFYAFTRRLSAYEEGLDGKTSLVLSSGSELFKYLESPRKRQ